MQCAPEILSALLAAAVVFLFATAVVRLIELFQGAGELRRLSRSISHDFSSVLLKSPLVPGVSVMFAPRDVPADFMGTLSREMMVRPIQLRANAEDAAFMIPQAKANAERYQELRMPVAIFAGAADKVIDPAANAERLHREISGSTLAVVPAAGHMVHYAAPDEVVLAVDAVQIPHLELAKQVA